MQCIQQNGPDLDGKASSREHVIALFSTSKACCLAEECYHLFPDAHLPIQVWSLLLGMQCIQLCHRGHPVAATGRWIVPPNRLHVEKLLGHGVELPDP